MKNVNVKESLCTVCYRMFLFIKCPVPSCQSVRKTGILRIIRWVKSRNDSMIQKFLVFLREVFGCSQWKFTVDQNILHTVQDICQSLHPNRKWGENINQHFQQISANSAPGRTFFHRQPPSTKCQTRLTWQSSLYWNFHQIYQKQFCESWFEFESFGCSVWP